MLDEALEVLKAGLDGLDELRARHPGHRFRVVRQQEEHDGSVHHDLLITCPDGSTVTLSHCPDRELPWPLRGLRPPTRPILLRVNGVERTIQEVVLDLEDLWADRRIAERLVNTCLIQQELDTEPVELDEAELERAVEAFRRTKGLLTVAATRQWLAGQGLDESALTELAARHARAARLDARLPGGLSAWLAERRATAKVEWFW
ncbi:TIGR04500 family putative peptide maturation system protein [Nonomuraea sp. NPDC050310]|uniref:TIGR04500 family putative peptide maturation system protein n=1 Tax=unclassified Nonomuraea TaxID=2593643 RepID=UPI0033EC6893